MSEQGRIGACIEINGVIGRYPNMGHMFPGHVNNFNVHLIAKTMEHLEWASKILEIVSSYGLTFGCSIPIILTSYMTLE